MLDSSFFDFDWENELPIPWNLHGDGAPFTEVDSLKVVSVRCPLSSLDVEHSQLMLAAVPKQATVTTTWAPLWQALADSFEILAQGKKTRRGIVLSIVGDLEFFCQEFGFPTVMSNQCCPFCMATNFQGWLANYGWLAKEAMKQKLCRYSITQKHHLFACRYIEQCQKLTPRMTWCYGPESFMSMCIKIGAASVKGTPAAKLPGKVLEKFRFSYHMLLAGLLDLSKED